MKYAIYLLVALGFCFACTNPPDYPDEPEIEFLRLSKPNLDIPNRDSLLLTIGFTDGDGDLGYEDKTPNIFFIDKRTDSDTVFLTYATPMVSLQGAGNGISGEISVVLNGIINVCCIYPDGSNPCQANPLFPTDTVVYEIYIKDRAGNESNRILADPIVLLCN